MDIAKYLTTAVVLSSIFGDVQEKWVIYVGGSLSIVVTLLAGLWLVKDKRKENNHGSLGNVRTCFGNSYCWSDLFQPSRQERSPKG